MRLIDKAFDVALDSSKLNWKEVDGPGSNKLIKQAYRAVDGLGDPDSLDDSSTAWCSAFANYCVQKAGGTGTRSALARSWLNWGKKSTGVMGDIVVLKRGTSTWQGHVGFVVKKNFMFVWVLGGNQSNTLNIDKHYLFNVLDFRTSLD